MKNIQTILKEILEYYSMDTLADILSTSASTINRWINSKSNPRPEFERKLRELHGNTLKNPHNTNLFKEVLDKILLELREILHRKGRLSSRNEALDQLSSLLFAHIMSVKHGEQGISSLIDANKNEASLLKNYVDEKIQKYIPKQLNDEMSWKDFELKIKTSENSFAKEVIQVFDKDSVSLAFSAIKNLDDVDIFNDVFGKFLTNSFVDEKELGQYLTPKEIVKAIVTMSLSSLSKKEMEILCHPELCKDFGIILDPSCGVSSFLSEILRILYRIVLNQHGPEKAKIWLHNMDKHVIYGIDKSERMIKLSITNFAMFGISISNIHLANSLEYRSSRITTNLVGKVRLILTNPPFGAEFTGDDLSSFKIANEGTSGVKSKLDSEILFIERYLDWLMPNGEMIAIVPDSILTNKGIYEKLRNYISPNIKIKGVISLPSETFAAAGTTTKTSILHIQKLNSEQITFTGTYFAVCQNIGYKVIMKGTQKSKITIEKNDFDKILPEYRVTENPCFGTYFYGINNESRWDANYHSSLPKSILSRLTEPASDNLYLSDVATLVNERVNPTRWSQETFPYIEISSIDSASFRVSPIETKCLEAPSRARKVVQTGDVLFSTVRPERGTIGIVSEAHDKAICTTGLAVIRPKDIDSMTLAYLLQTELVIAQILRYNTGIAYPVIDESCLPGILLPINKHYIDLFHKDAIEIIELQNRLFKKRSHFQQNILFSVDLWLKDVF